MASSKTCILLLQFLLLAAAAVSVMEASTTCSSAPVTQSTKATLTINNFEKGGDGGGPSECDGQYHSNDTPVVALSTEWYNQGSRCHHMIKISANGKSAKAMVVDECDCSRGCSCNIVDASKAVWKALGVTNSKDWGEMEVLWADAY